jgi:hypothetical protein
MHPENYTIAFHQNQTGKIKLAYSPIDIGRRRSYNLSGLRNKTFVLPGAPPAVLPPG